MAAAPPLMASGYLALMLGLDAALAVTLTLLSTALMPFTLPFVGLYLLEVEIDVAARRPDAPAGAGGRRHPGARLAAAPAAAGGFQPAPRRAARRPRGAGPAGVRDRDHGWRERAAAAPAGLRAACALAVYGLQRRPAGRGRPRLRLARPARRPHARPVQRQRQSRPAAGSARRSRLVRAVRVRCCRRSCRSTPCR